MPKWNQFWSTTADGWIFGGNPPSGGSPGDYTIEPGDGGGITVGGGEVVTPPPGGGGGGPIVMVGGQQVGTHTVSVGPGLGNTGSI